MSAYIPLHESPLQRDPSLQNWFRSWWESYGTPFGVLTPEGWFTTAHATGCFLWDVPPAAGEAAVEQLGKARHKRPQAVHIFVCPKAYDLFLAEDVGEKLRHFVYRTGRVASLACLTARTPCCRYLSPSFVTKALDL